MKFETKYPTARATDRFEFEYSHVTKTVSLGQCRWCGSFTKWLDVLFQTHACSEECLGAMWSQYRSDQKKESKYENFEKHFERVKEELVIAQQSPDRPKDVLIVVHNQLEYLKVCIDSINQTTESYHLYIWDNGSQPKTALYIEEVFGEANPESNRRVTTIRSDTNVGFIEPNNELAALGSNDYIILLNSDTKVFDHWDRALTGFLERHPDVGQVGYWGGHLGPDGRGFGGGNGYDVDYIPGWCFCISRDTYRRHGLFNKQLKFAYCEDADLSLRIKEAGQKIYSLHAPLVHHYQNKTIVEVEKEGLVDVAATFEHNHQYLRERWKDYLSTERVLLRKRMDSDESSHTDV